MGIDKLKNIEVNDLYDMLCDESRWDSLDIDYHPPHVERLWTQYDGEYRLMLHRIYPCEEKDSLFHPHPWKSAVHVLPIGNGIYGHSVGTIGDQRFCKMEVKGDFYYEMQNMNGYHSVLPIGEPVYSIMLISTVCWPENNLDFFELKGIVKPDNLEELKPETKQELLSIFKNHYKSLVL